MQDFDHQQYESSSYFAAGEAPGVDLGVSIVGSLLRLTRFRVRILEYVD